jgi:hypothetical protein
MRNAFQGLSPWTSRCRKSLNLLTPIRKFPHRNTAIDILAQLTSPRHRQTLQKLQSTRPTINLIAKSLPFHSFNRGVKSSQRSRIVNFLIWQDKGTHCHGSSFIGPLCHDDFEKMCWYCDGGWISDDFVCDAPFSVGVLSGEIEWSSKDANRRVFLSQSTTEIFEMGPVCVSCREDVQSRLNPSPTCGHMFVK